MNQDRWQQIDELFDAVLDLPEAERDGFLSSRCNGDEDLRREVLSLLEAQKSSENFLQKSAMNIAARNLAEEQTFTFDAQFLNKTVGTYKIESLLGAGGMGEVYLAYDKKLKRQVALKILPAEYVSSDERVKRFELEARAISALNHPNIVTVYDVETVEGVSYIATEYVEGKTLRELIGSGIKLKDVIAIIIQACDALSAAHKAGIIHRDIKPENIMVRPDGYVKILDFGLAKLNEVNLNTLRNFANTAKGVIIGTPAYMSPEQVADEKVDHRTDLWSIGVVLYELLTGVNPFKKENRQATFQAILSSEPPLASTINADIPAELDQILIKALEKDADLSYQTASDLCADLKRVKREVDSSPSWSSASAIERKTRTRKKALYFALAASVLIILGLGSWLVYSAYFPEEAKQAAEWTNARHSQLTDFSGVEAFPTLSPDGKILVYMRVINGSGDIFWQRIGGSNAQNLTPDSPEHDTNPAFSPDGEHIAFRSNRSGGGIFIMGATGEAVKRLTDFGYNPAWSPDGKIIVFSTIEARDPTARNIDGELWAVEVQTGAKRQIKTGVDSLQPQFSPDGKRIAFWGKDSKYQRDLYTIGAEGGEAVRVMNDADLDWSPNWSPDGKYLYFCSNRNGGASIWRIAINAENGQPLGEPEAVVAPLAQSSILTLSRDGKQLVYVRRNRIENIYKVDFDPAKMQVTGKPAAITESTKRARTVDVSPDGKQVAFYLTGEAQEDIILVRTDDLKWNQLTNDEARDRVPRFSPDGSRLAFYSNASGNYEIWTIKTDGSERRQLTEYGGRGLQYPIWSPDGSRLAYTSFDGNMQIIETGKTWAEQTPLQIPPLNDKGDRFVGWSWSPDGKKIAGWRADENDSEYPEVYVYSFETNSFERIGGSSLHRPVWLADSRHLLLCKGESLAILDTQTKELREILSLSPQIIDTPAITPDNRQIFFDIIESESDILMLSLK